MLIDQIRESIKEFIKRKNLKISDIADAIDIDRRTISNFLDKGKGNLTTVEKILRYLSRMGWDYEVAYPVPIYEEVSAGEGREIFGEEIGTVLVPRRLGRKSVVAIKVRGNSMEPALVDGSIIGVDTDQKELRHGKIYVLYIPYKGAVVKRIFFSEEGRIMAKSDNMEYPDLILDGGENVHVVGRVIWSFQEY